MLITHHRRVGSHFKTKYGYQREKAPFVFSRQYAQILGGKVSCFAIVLRLAYVLLRARRCFNILWIWRVARTILCGAMQCCSSICSLWWSASVCRNWRRVKTSNTFATCWYLTKTIRCGVGVVFESFYLFHCLCIGGGVTHDAADTRELVVAQHTTGRIHSHRSKLNRQQNVCVLCVICCSIKS